MTRNTPTTPASNGAPAASASSVPPDPRRHAYRSDLAAKSLEGVVKAEHYVAGTHAQIVRGSVPLRKHPDATRGLETEALFGEAVTVYDEANGWAWIQLVRDGYVGYVPSDVLARNPLPATHRVQSLGTFLYPLADIKSPPVMHLPLNAVFAVRGADDKFVEIAQGGYVVSRHVSAIDRSARDFVEIAERFIGTPYLWGGRTRIGIDCSGIVQMSLHAAGQSAPRDSDMQFTELGHLVRPAQHLDGLERGDLVFWKGHVGIMTDGIMLVHANAHHMAVAIEPLQDVAMRIAKTGSEILAIKRLKMRVG